jgi:hypothetical protein
MTTMKVRLYDIEYSDILSLYSIFTPLNSNIDGASDIEYSDKLVKYGDFIAIFEITGNNGSP